MSGVDQVRQQLVDSQLMTAQTADGHIGQWRQQTGPADEADGDQFVQWLVTQQVLTEFQGDALRAGHTGPFTLGPYLVFGRMALGRLGNIYHAVHEELDQPVSLKVFPSSLKDDPEKVARMQREFVVSLGLEHPNIVRSFQIGKVGDIHFHAFQDLKGEILLDRIEREGGLPYAEACGLIRQAALALAYLHEKGLVHRDVHPGNMWLTESGVLKLMEWGAIRDALGEVVVTPEEGSVTTTETVLGTFDYMAPEQAQDAHAADHRSDIYSLGCSLYHCLSGKKPFREKNPIKLVIQHASKMPTPLVELVPDVPRQLSDAVNSMMAKSPSDRFQKTQDVVWALEKHVRPDRLEVIDEETATPEYLRWLRSATEEATAARSPELANFLAWMADEDSTEA